MIDAAILTTILVFLTVIIIYSMYRWSVWCAGKDFGMLATFFPVIILAWIIVFLHALSVGT